MEKQKHINSASTYKEWIKEEGRLYKTSFLAKLLLINERAILLRHQVLLRKTELYTNTNRKLLKLLYRFRLIKMQNKYGIHIPINCCGKGLHIMHLGPILINDTAQIGENCSIHINTAIVAGGTSNVAARLGDGIVIGVGAVIVGNVYLANNIAIGANAVVCKSFNQENVAVAGVPAKVVSNNGSLNWNN